MIKDEENTLKMVAKSSKDAKSDENKIGENKVSDGKDGIVEKSSTTKADSNPKAMTKEERHAQVIARLPKYEKSEEIINVVTHAVGAVIGVVALVAMTTLAIMSKSAGKIVGSVVFGLSLVWLYTMSTLYHNEKVPEMRRIRQKFDHLSINILIAGSVTFYMLAVLNDWRGYAVGGAVWALSIVAMVLNSINVKKFRAITMVTYILTGWLPVMLCVPLYHAMGLSGILTLGIGGLFYTVGLTAYAIHKKYMHAIWHFFVLGGSISHIVGAIIFLAA